VNGRPDSEHEPAEAPPEKEPKSLGDIPITDRWAPLVRDPDSSAPTPPKMGQRVIASALSLIVLALILWAIS
jgi:hypothetical protein